MFFLVTSFFHFLFFLIKGKTTRSVLPRIGSTVTDPPPASFGQSYQSINESSTTSSASSSNVTTTTTAPTSIAKPKRQGSESDAKTKLSTMTRAQTPPQEVTLDLGLTGTSIKDDPSKGPNPPTTQPGRPAIKRPGQVINFRDEINKAIQSGSEQIDFHGDRLMKPLSTFGYSGEMRELAAVISRDIFSSNPGVRYVEM